MKATLGLSLLVPGMNRRAPHISGLDKPGLHLLGKSVSLSRQTAEPTGVKHEVRL